MPCAVGKGFYWAIATCRILGLLFSFGLTLLFAQGEEFLFFYLPLFMMLYFFFSLLVLSFVPTELACCRGLGKTGRAVIGVIVDAFAFIAAIFCIGFSLPFSEPADMLSTILLVFIAIAILTSRSLDFVGCCCVLPPHDTSERVGLVSRSV